MKLKKLVVMMCVMCLAFSTSAFAAVTNPNANAVNVSQWRQFEVQKMEDHSTGYTRAMQRILAQYSSYTREKILNNYGCNGSFGSATENALMYFQNNQGVSADGHCGPVTWGGLASMLEGSGYHPNGYFYYKTFSGCYKQYYAIRQGDSTGNWAAQSGSDTATSYNTGGYTTFHWYE